MGNRYQHWRGKTLRTPQSFPELKRILLENRTFEPITKLEYGDHGLAQVIETVLSALKNQKRIALYADYDVDGTMSCVSWIWFFKAIGYDNFVHYIPCRFKEGYGVNLKAVQHLVEEEKAELIITMDTGITANEEAAYCRSVGVDFICTDHHKIQPEKMPDCHILNPKMHPSPNYQELCGCGITFVLLRKLAEQLQDRSDAWPSLWVDLLALAGIATICDVVPLNPVNHRLARLGVDALLKSQRPILRELRETTRSVAQVSESDVGFRIGPRINAVGRLEHANAVIEAFVDEKPQALIPYIESCNEQRKKIQGQILYEAISLAPSQETSPILFLGGNWHPGVVGIAASRLVEEFWKPTFLFQIKDGIAKGSARSIPGFDVTEAMGSAKQYFTKFGGHKYAGGFSFDAKNLEKIQECISAFASHVRSENPALWESSLDYDCELPTNLTNLELLDLLQTLRPYGNEFDEPNFLMRGEVLSIQHLSDKETKLPKHSVIQLKRDRRIDRLIAFQNVIPKGSEIKEFIVSVSKNTYRGNDGLSVQVVDWN